MEYLVLFVLGIIFDRCLLPLLDILFEWFTNVVSSKVHLIQSNMAVTNKEVNDYCQKDEKLQTHAIGFMMDNPSVEDEEE